MGHCGAIGEGLFSIFSYFCSETDASRAVGLDNVMDALDQEIVIFLIVGNDRKQIRS